MPVNYIGAKRFDGGKMYSIYQSSWAVKENTLVSLKSCNYFGLGNFFFVNH